MSKYRVTVIDPSEVIDKLVGTREVEAASKLEAADTALVSMGVDVPDGGFGRRPSSLTIKVEPI